MYKLQIGVGLCRDYRDDNLTDTARSLILSYIVSLCRNTCPRRMLLVFKTG